MKKISFLTSLILICITSCSEEKTEKTTLTKYVEDSHSYAKPNEASTNHLDLNIEVDFETKQIKGTATYKIKMYIRN